MAVFGVEFMRWKEKSYLNHLIKESVHCVSGFISGCSVFFSFLSGLIPGNTNNNKWLNEFGVFLKWPFSVQDVEISGIIGNIRTIFNKDWDQKLLWKFKEITYQSRWWMKDVLVMWFTKNQMTVKRCLSYGQALFEDSRIHRDFKIRSRWLWCPACVTDSLLSYPEMPKLTDCWTESQDKVWNIGWLRGFV